MKSRLSQIEQTTLARNLNYTAGDRRVDEKRGARDGKDDRPANDAEAYPFRQEVIAEAQAALKAYREQLENELTRTEHRKGEIQRELDEHYAARRAAIQQEFSDRVDELGLTIGPTSAKRLALEEKNNKATDRERRIEAHLGRPLRVHLIYIYWFIMAGVALVELPINRFAFELFFSETPQVSAMVALGVGVALMFLAHFGGTWVKHGFGAETTPHRVAYFIGFAVCVLLVTPTIYMIALLRQHYVDFIERTQTSFSDLLLQDGIEGFARDVVGTELGAQGWMLLMINLVVVGIGVISAIVRHDSHPDYEKAVRAQKRVSKKLEQLKTRYDTAITKAKAKQSKELENLDKQQKGLEDELSNLSSEQEVCHGHKGRVVERVALHVKRRILAYESGNDSTRKAKSPAAFGSVDEKQIQLELEGALADENSGRSGLHAVS